MSAALSPEPDELYGSGLSGDGGAGDEGMPQGLYVTAPAEELSLEGFAADGRADTMAPGPLLAMVLDTVAGPDGEGLAGLSDDQLVGFLSGARRMESRLAWAKMAALAEFASRPGGPASPPTRSPAAFRLTWLSVAGEIAYAQAVTRRLPVTLAALAAGKIDPVHVKIIEEFTSILSADDAAIADEILAAAARAKTYGELRRAASRLVLRLDREAVSKRKEKARREARVRAFREESGNAGITGREMPSVEVLASMQHVEDRARALRAAGVPGTWEELKVRATLDLLQERDSRQTPGESSASGSGKDGDGGSGRGGPSIGAQVTITVPATALGGDTGPGGEVDGFGILDHADTRDLIAAAAHACATGPRPWRSAHGPPGRQPGTTTLLGLLDLLNITQLTPVIRGPAADSPTWSRPVMRPARDNHTGLSTRLRKWSQVMHDEDKDGRFPDESPVEVHYPRSKQERQSDRERWPWLPGPALLSAHRPRARKRQEPMALIAGTKVGSRGPGLAARPGYAAIPPSAGRAGSPSPVTSTRTTCVERVSWGAAPAGEASAAWARPRGSLAARKIALSHTASAATGTTAITASCHADRAEFGFMRLHPVRVGEAVAHRYDPFDSPHLGQDVPALLNGFGAAFEGHDAVLDRDGEGARVAAKVVQDHVLRDFRADLVVGAAVDTQHIDPADDPGQMTVLADHRKSFHPALVHEAGGAGDGFACRNGDRRRCHELGGGDRGRPGEIVVMRPGPCGRPSPDRYKRFLVQQVRLGYYADDLAVIVEDGKRADPVPREQSGDVLEWSILPDRHHPAGHNVFHRGAHSVSPFLFGS
jgi:Domain of unknown function (DUF222)